MKPIVWLGDSRARLRAFPDDAARVFGKRSRKTAREDIELARARFRGLVEERRRT
jgi:phage-related protein